MLPAWLMWLLPVPVATLAAVAWASWSARVRPQDPADTVEQYARFRAALARPCSPGSADRTTSLPDDEPAGRRAGLIPGGDLR